MIIWRRIALVFLLATCAVASAQQAPTESTEAQQSASEETRVSTPEQAEATEEASPELIVPDSASSSAPPGEYRASEQISEDLSVSYPVDI